MKITSELLYKIGREPVKVIHCMECGRTFRDEAEKQEYLQKRFPNRYPPKLKGVSTDSSDANTSHTEQRQGESEPEVIESPNINEDDRTKTNEEDTIEMYSLESDLENEAEDFYSEKEVDISIEGDPVGIGIAPTYVAQTQAEEKTTQENRFFAEEKQDSNSSYDCEVSATSKNGNTSNVMQISNLTSLDGDNTDDLNANESLPFCSSGVSHMQPITAESAIVSHRSSQLQVSSQCRESLFINQPNEDAVYCGFIESLSTDLEDSVELMNALLQESNLDCEQHEDLVKETSFSGLPKTISVDGRSTHDLSNKNELTLEREMNILKRPRSRSPSVEYLKEVPAKRAGRRNVAQKAEIISPCTDANLALAIKLEKVSDYELGKPYVTGTPICSLDESETTNESGNFALMQATILENRADEQIDLNSVRSCGSFMIPEGSNQSETDLVKLEEEKISICDVKIECKPDIGSIKNEFGSPRRGKQASYCSFCGSASFLPAEINMEGKLKTETPAACLPCRLIFTDLKIIVAGTSIFTCSKENCNRKFTRKSGLISHFRSHTKMYGTNPRYAPKEETIESDSDNDAVATKSANLIEPKVMNSHTRNLRKPGTTSLPSVSVSVRRVDPQLKRLQKGKRFNLRQRSPKRREIMFLQQKLPQGFQEQIQELKMDNFGKNKGKKIDKEAH